MTTVRTNVLCLIFIATTIAVAAYLYPSLPEQIPTHWNFEGEVDDYTPKPWGVMIMPLTAVLVFVIMKLIPVISPKGFRTDQFRGVVNIFTVTLVGFMSAIGLLVLLAASGRSVHINEMVFAGVGLLFIVLGNYLGKVRKNFFIGIRTPWTLASDEVWNRTHRLGGWIFVLIGFFMFLNAFIRFPEGWLIGSIVIVALIPIVYSYVLYRKIEGFDEETPDTD
ncbi:MAG: SdpI family protein [Gammaproteobacteria bacterium]|nr:SdpI family protein [Gammaproteobacteria bacterium]MBT8109758.1 SdpI family protein [Gammaproteobacteria bacterium]NND47472.1 SdpI family protein [Woeseiaceae bacterium]NNL44459.1 SdpI family protein [Woeseiaceae bacterium]